MRKTEYYKLVAYYGMKLADKAVRWFVDNYKAQTRNGIRQFKFVVANESLWRN